MYMYILWAPAATLAQGTLLVVFVGTVTADASAMGGHRKNGKGYKWTSGHRKTVKGKVNNDNPSSKQPPKRCLMFKWVVMSLCLRTCMIQLVRRKSCYSGACYALQMFGGFGATCPFVRNIVRPSSCLIAMLSTLCRAARVVVSPRCSARRCTEWVADIRGHLRGAEFRCSKVNKTIQAP